MSRWSIALKLDDNSVRNFTVCSNICTVDDMTDYILRGTNSMIFSAPDNGCTIYNSRYVKTVTIEKLDDYD